jgi:NADPH2:quinone reductase
MRAVRIHERGATSVLRLEDLPTPTPGANDVLIKVAAAGVNYSDVGQRRGDYPNLVPLPATLGNEVAGTVAALGASVTGLREGDRVVALVDGGYAEYAVAPAGQVVALPDAVSFEAATAVPIQGQTAYLALTKAARLSAGETVLIHAAAGGVGSLAVQIARLLGAGMIIATDRKPEKFEFIRSLGANVVVSSTDPNWMGAVMGATRGQGVDIVLETIGGEVGQASLMSLAPFGRLVVFGSLSGQPSPLVSQMLIPKCWSVIGYNTLVQPDADKRRASETLLAWMAEGRLNVALEHTYPLEEAAAAHTALEAGQTRGKIVLTLNGTHGS